MLRLDRARSSAVHYQRNYVGPGGFIPQTPAEDDDSLARPGGGPVGHAFLASADGLGLRDAAGRE